jgi:hypothetical protein
MARMDKKRKHWDDRLPLTRDRGQIWTGIICGLVAIVAGIVWWNPDGKNAVAVGLFFVLLGLVR